MILNIQQLMQQHQKVVAEAIAAGHVDPTAPEHYDQSGCMLKFKMRGRTFLQFFAKYGTVSTQILQKDQVRKKQVNSDHVSELAARIQADGVLFHPIKTRYISDTAEKIEHGHHRPDAWEIIHPNKPIPRFILAEEMFEETTDDQGNPSYSVADKIPYRREHARSIPNPPADNLPYEMDDVAVQLGDAMKLDSTLDGRKSASEKLTLEHVKDWMKERHPQQFLKATTRGKILKKWQRGLIDGQIKPYRNKKEQESNLKSNSWDDNVDTFLNWYDDTDNVLQGCITYRRGGEVLRVQVQKLIEEYHLGTKLEEYNKLGCKKVRFYIEIDTNTTKFKAQIPYLKAERTNCMETVHTMNDLLDKCSVLYQITEVYFPQQLQHQSDKGGIVDVAQHKAQLAAKTAVAAQQTKSSTVETHVH